jgi:DNA-binding XRE family transcriptional regulator
MSPRIKIKVKLKDYLASMNVTPYMLGKWVEGVSSQTIFAVANESRRPSLEVLESILNGLRSNGYLTSLSDIVQVEEVEE